MVKEVDIAKSVVHEINHNMMWCWKVSLKIDWKIKAETNDLLKNL